MLVGGGVTGRVCVLIRWVRSGRRGGGRVRGTWLGGAINSTKSLVIMRAMRVLNLKWEEEAGIVFGRIMLGMGKIEAVSTMIFWHF